MLYCLSFSTTVAAEDRRSMLSQRLNQIVLWVGGAVTVCFVCWYAASYLFQYSCPKATSVTEDDISRWSAVKAADGNADCLQRLQQHLDDDGGNVGDIESSLRRMSAIANELQVMFMEGNSHKILRSIMSLDRNLIT